MVLVETVYGECIVASSLKMQQSQYWRSKILMSNRCFHLRISVFTRRCMAAESVAKVVILFLCPMALPTPEHLCDLELFLTLQVAEDVALKGLRPKLPEDMGGLKPLLLQCWQADPLLRSDSLQI
jgi:hypothetical protein